MNVLTARAVVLEETAESVLLGCELLVDDVPVAGREAAAISVSQLEASGRGDGDFWILTCSCGEPGCAGLMSPIRVRYAGASVTWEEDASEPRSARRFVVAADGVTRPDDLPATPARRFEFDAAQYRTTIETFVRGLPAFVATVARRTGRAAQSVPHGEAGLFGLAEGS